MDHESSIIQKLEKELAALEKAIKERKAELDKAAADAVIQHRVLGEQDDILNLDRNVQYLIIRHEEILSKIKVNKPTDEFSRKKR